MKLCHQKSRTLGSLKWSRSKAQVEKLDSDSHTSALNAKGLCQTWYMPFQELQPTVFTQNRNAEDEPSCRLGFDSFASGLKPDLEYRPWGRFFFRKVFLEFMGAMFFKKLPWIQRYFRRRLDQPMEYEKGQSFFDVRCQNMSKPWATRLFAWKMTKWPWRIPRHCGSAWVPVSAQDLFVLRWHLW